MSKRRIWILGACVLAVAAAVLLRLGGARAELENAATAAKSDKSLSPFFVVEGADPGVEALPLESTKARVHIAGVIADVTVQQVYRNDGTKPISARYVFPASTRAAVYGMKMTIGDRVITAKIKEREEARAEYERAKSEGKTASLLEEDRPNVFSMRVANILPSDRIQVELRYTELLVPTDGVYQLVYPTVVGPRYASATTDQDAAENQFVASPYGHDSDAPEYTFGLSVDIAAGLPIQSIDSPSHLIHSQFASGRGSARVALDKGEAHGGNRDFILNYRLSGKDIASGMLLGQNKDENFFLLMVQPPARPSPEQIPAREYVFIVDVSGSMHGFPLDVSKSLLRDLVGRLRPTDRFNVLLFAGDSRLYSNASVPASQSEIDNAIAFIDQENGGGGTELLPALQRALQLPRAKAGISRSFVVVTDGYIAEEAAMFEHVRDHLDEANLFAFGIGTSVNRHLVEGLAKAGQGEAFVLEDESNARATAARFREYVESPVLTGVKLSFEGFDAYDVSPRVLPDVFARRPVVVFGKYRGKPAGKAILTGVSGRGRFVSTMDVATFAPDAKNGALAQLWARDRIAELSDFFLGDSHRDQVVELGLRYNLLTRFTSFIAVHEVVRSDGQSLDVDQPLPMPEAVSDLAIGVESGAEPPLLLLMGLLLLGVGWRLWRARREGLVR